MRRGFPYLLNGWQPVDKSMVDGGTGPSRSTPPGGPLHHCRHSSSSIHPFKGLKVTACCFAIMLGSRGVPTRSAQGSHADKIECSSVSSTILGRSVNFCVVLPDGYDASSLKRYPSLYFLHGLFENEHSLIDRGGEQIWKNLTSQDQITDFIVILPDGGRSFYVNSQDGHERYEDFFLQELVPEIDRRYRTVATAAERGVSGTSMGGYGALHLAMEHPDMFGSASAHSAALLPKFPTPIPSEGRWGFLARVIEEPFGSPINEGYWKANSPLTLAEHPERFAHLHLYFDCGNHDRYGFEEGAKLLDHILSGNSFPHEYALREGDHGWSYLHQYLQFSLRFHSKVFTRAQKAITTTSAKKEAQ